jgi:hypothetical protein
VAAERFRVVQTEISYDPHSDLMRYHEVRDDNGDPLDLLCRCEDQDEVALEIIACLRRERKSESMRPVTQQ